MNPRSQNLKTKAGDGTRTHDLRTLKPRAEFANQDTNSQSRNWKTKTQIHNLRTEKLRHKFTNKDTNSQSQNWKAKMQIHKQRHKFSGATLRQQTTCKMHTNKRTSKGSFGVPGCHVGLGRTSKWKNLVGKSPLISRSSVHPRIMNRWPKTRGSLMAELRVETYLTQETVDSTTRLGS